MKKMMLKFIAAAAVCAAVTAASAADRFEISATVAAGDTSVIVTQKLFRAYGAPCGTVDSVFATASSGAGTGTVVFALHEYGVSTTFSTLTDVRSGTAGYDRPINKLSSLYTYPVVQNVVTGDFAYAVQNLQTNYAVVLSPYVARQVKVTITQGAVANDTIYKVVIYVKEDPPLQKMP